MILGKTDKKRLLSVIFTQRGKKIRIISARPMSRKESSGIKPIRANILILTRQNWSLFPT